MNSSTRALALAGVSFVLLTGCQTAKQKAYCPSVAILANTSSFTVFKPGLQGDPSGELYTIQATTVDSSCNLDLDEGTTDSDIDVSFRATRAPSGDEATYTAPYYVAVHQDGTTIISKKILGTAFTFAPGQSTVTFSENIPSTEIRLQNGVKPYQYSLLVGLQLTREQFDYQKTGHITP